MRDLCMMKARGAYPTDLNDKQWPIFKPVIQLKARAVPVLTMLFLYTRWRMPASFDPIETYQDGEIIVHIQPLDCCPSTHRRPIISVPSRLH